MDVCSVVASWTSLWTLRTRHSDSRPRSGKLSGLRTYKLARHTHRLCGCNPDLHSERLLHGHNSHIQYCHVRHICFWLPRHHYSTVDPLASQHRRGSLYPILQLRRLVFHRPRSNGRPNFSHLRLYLSFPSPFLPNTHLTPTGSDAAAHISEEVYSASLTVPRTMVYSYAINGLMGFLTLITFLFALTDLDAALTDPSTYPFLWVFQNALPLPALNTLTAVLLILVFAGSVTFSISTSRQTWSFARDHGLPCSSWIARVEPKRELPVNAILLTCLCTCALSLINIGSSVAFNAIISLNLVSLMLTYSTSIGCVLLRRLRDPESLPRARWALGRWGIPINAGALAYSLFAFFWCFWPNTTPVDVTSFNWAVVIFVGVAVIAITCYILQGRHIYEGPVVLVKEVENEG